MTNKSIIKNLNLSEGEHIKLVVRRYFMVYWWQALLIALLLLLPFFLLYPLFQWTPWGPIIFAVLLAAGVLGLIRLYVSWYFNCLVVTSQRLVDFDQKGPLDRTVSEVPLERVDDISYRRRGLFQSLFNYGIIQYSIPPGRAKIVVKGVKNPQTVCQQVIGLVEESRSSKGQIYDGSINTVSGLKKLLKEMHKELGPEGFQRVIEEIEMEGEHPQVHNRDREIKKFLQEDDQEDRVEEE